MSVIPPIPHTMPEAVFQRLVIAFARRHGWLVCHYPQSSPRTGRWVTAVQGDLGGPDLILARDGVVLLIELKGPKTVVTPMQKQWAAASGRYGGVFRPADWPRLAELLLDPLAA